MALVLSLAGCAAMQPALPRSGPAADAQTRFWQHEVTRLGQNGDWLVIHGNSSTDLLVAAVAAAELSHVGILDVKRAEVVEAVSPVVQCIPLQNFLEEADRVQLIRPTGADRRSG